ncbi:hypothetical protein H8356DRAFT_1303983 [Neocallimastix lanati (nom. inval.)]|nr:hypothetical protein H8356DRAFT_1303983 [Neocallimastix sp. JGI-2020a]
MGIRFPKINRCLCCCWVDFYTAIKGCTMLLTMLYGIITIFSFVDVAVFACIAPLFISFIFLSIGIYNGKLSFMEQFIIIYFVKLFIQGIIITIGLLAATFIDGTSIIGDYSERVVFVIVIFFILFIYGLAIYYYICVGSYTQFFAEEIKKSNEARKLESNGNKIK